MGSQESTLNPSDWKGNQSEVSTVKVVNNVTVNVDATAKIDATTNVAADVTGLVQEIKDVTKKETTP